MKEERNTEKKRQGKRRNEKKRKRGKRKRKSEPIMRQRIPKISWSWFCVFNLLLVMETCFKITLLVHWDFIIENYFFFICSHLLIWHSFCYRCGFGCSCLSTRISFGSGPCWPYTCCHNLCELICALVLLYLESFVSFMSYIHSGSYPFCLLFCRIPWVLHEGFEETFH